MERVADQGAGGFRGIALAPVFAAKAVAELGGAILRVEHAQAQGAHHPARGDDLGRHADLRARPDGLLGQHAIEECTCLVLRVGTPGHEAADLGIGAVAMDVGQVRLAELAQDQARRGQRQPGPFRGDQGFHWSLSGESRTGARSI